jgi:hypothetical protein
MSGAFCVSWHHIIVGSMSIPVLTPSVAELRAIFLSLGIERAKAIRVIHGGGRLHSEFDVSAEDFLQRAEDDFELGGDAAAFNAIANAKRAIHAQVDEILSMLGYPTKGRGFDKRLAIFSDLGLAAPRILKRINDARNILEHEYELPTSVQIEEAIDLAALFVGATKRHSETWEHEFTMGNRDDQLDEFTFSNEIAAGFDEGRKIFKLSGWKGSKSLSDLTREPKGQPATCVGGVELVAGDLLFADVVRLVIAGDHKRKTANALARLFDRLQL